MSALDLTRSVPFQLERAEGDDGAGDGQTLEGIAAVFDTPTRIDSWEGTFDEQIRRGAFRKTIRERTPVMQFDHGRHPLIGSIPLGAINELREGDAGLFVSARLTDNWLIQPIRDAIAEGSIDGMSFRFEVVREEWRDQDGKLLKDESEILQLLYRPDDRGPLMRTLLELKVPELGPVVFPAYRETAVGVRARNVAATAAADDDFVHQIRASLARSVEAIPEDLDDPALRGEVARALLFDAQPEKDAKDNPEGAPPEREGHPPAEENRTEDAPPTGHPSEGTDAPPAEGHPSMSSRRMTAELARLNGRIDAAERHLDLHERRSAHDG